MTGKNKIYIVDTNVIVRYLLGEESILGEKAFKFFEPIQSGIKKVQILESVFTETVYILSSVYKVDKNKIFLALNGLLRYKGVINDNKQLLIRALATYRDSNLHIVDCILASMASNNNNVVVTFDKELNKYCNNQDL